jgi:hypothetical protein
MGFLDKFRKKEKADKNSETTSTEQDKNKPSTTGKRVKKYTSDGKPIYE